MVVGQYSNNIHFRVERTTELEKLKKTYSELVLDPINPLRFPFNGMRINDEETPKSSEMELDDVIEVYQEQIRERADEPGTEYFKLKFVRQDLNEIHLRVKMTTRVGNTIRRNFHLNWKYSDVVPFWGWQHSMRDLMIF